MYQLSDHEVFEDGQVIFDEDSQGDWVYIIEQGAVELSKMIGGNESSWTHSRRGTCLERLVILPQEGERQRPPLGAKQSWVWWTAHFSTMSLASYLEAFDPF